MSSVLADAPAEIAPNPDADGLVGEVKLWTSDTLPNAKYLFCDGAAVSRTTYSLLFSRIGTSFGAGDGSTTFNLPSGGKVPVFFDISDADFDTIGETGGTKDATMPTHGHPLTGAPDVGSLAISPNPHNHTHNGAVAGPGTDGLTVSPSVSIADLSGTTSSTSLSITGAPSAGTLAVSDAAGSGNNMPPYQVFRPIIKVL